jgi:hypothetical protein
MIDVPGDTPAWADAANIFEADSVERVVLAVMCEGLDHDMVPVASYFVSMGLLVT